MNRARRGYWVGGGVLAAGLVCCLPQGDEELPDTAVPGVAREFVLRLLAPPDVRRVGRTVPITVEATFGDAEAVAASYCVRLAGEPGRLEFPFGAGCDAVDGRANAGSAEGARASFFSRAHACLRPEPIAGGRSGATLIAAYVPEGGETTATLFGALYDNPRCSGQPVVSTARALELRGARGADGDGGAADGGAPDSGGGQGDAGGPADAGGPLPSLDGGVADAGEDAS